MRRDSRVLLMAVVDSADAIADAVKAIRFDDYCNSRLSVCRKTLSPRAFSSAKS
jgi:hypothetical protein